MKKMSNLTYEYTDLRSRLETIEWDNAWIEHSENHTAARILHIGDSISVGTRHIGTRVGAGKVLFDNFGTSKAVDNPYFKDAVRLFAAQIEKRNAVIFNNGLHGWHLDDTTEYPEYYEDIVKFLIDNFKGTPVYIVLTTHVKDNERDERVKKRNEAATAIANKYGLGIIDLYSASASDPDFLSGDGVHLTDDGYTALAKTIIESVKEHL